MDALVVQGEFENWRSQFVTSNSDKMGLRRAHYNFTELIASSKVADAKVMGVLK